MERINIEQLLATEEQKLAWKFIQLKIREYLTSGFNGRIVIDTQAGRISGLHNIDFISGITQINYYLDKIV